MRTEYSFINSETPPNQPAIINSLLTIPETHKLVKYRAMAARVLIGLTRANTPEHIETFCGVA